MNAQTAIAEDDRALLERCQARIVWLECRNAELEAQNASLLSRLIESQKGETRDALRRIGG